MPRTSPEQVRKDLGRRVAETRRARSLTQAQLAEIAGVTPQYLARVEAGGENLTLDSVTKLANLLEVAVVDLFMPPISREVRRGRPPREPMAEPPTPAQRRPRRRGARGR